MPCTVTRLPVSLGFSGSRSRLRPSVARPVRPGPTLALRFAPGLEKLPCGHLGFVSELVSVRLLSNLLWSTNWCKTVIISVGNPGFGLARLPRRPST